MLGPVLIRTIGIMTRMKRMKIIKMTTKGTGLEKTNIVRRMKRMHMLMALVFGSVLVDCGGGRKSWDLGRNG